MAPTQNAYSWHATPATHQGSPHKSMSRAYTKLDIATKTIVSDTRILKRILCKYNNNKNETSVSWRLHEKHDWRATLATHQGSPHISVPCAYTKLDVAIESIVEHTRSETYPCK